MHIQKKNNHVLIEECQHLLLNLNILIKILCPGYLHEHRILLQELDGLKEIPPILVIDGRTKKKEDVIAQALSFIETVHKHEITDVHFVRGIDVLRNSLQS